MHQRRCEFVPAHGDQVLVTLRAKAVVGIATFAVCKHPSKRIVDGLLVPEGLRNIDGGGGRHPLPTQAVKRSSALAGHCFLASGKEAQCIAIQVSNGKLSSPRAVRRRFRDLHTSRFEFLTKLIQHAVGDMQIDRTVWQHFTGWRSQLKTDPGRTRVGTIASRHPSMSRRVTVFKVNVKAEDVAIPIKCSSDIGNLQDHLRSVNTVAISQFLCVHRVCPSDQSE